MPYNGSGVFSIINTFVPNTTILSGSVNANFTDIASGLSDALTRDGQLGMTSALKLADGTVGNPALSFTTETNTGLYRVGTGQLGFDVAGTKTFTMQAPSTAAGAGFLGTGGVVLFPIGIVQDFAGSTAPSGWFLCYGQALLRASYPELYAILGTTYGAGDGSTNFILPDFRGIASAGLDNMGGVAAGRLTAIGSGTTLGAAGGEQSHTLTLAESASHTHTATVSDPTHTHTSNAVGITVGAGFQGGSGGAQFGATINAAATGITVANDFQGGGGAHNNLQPTMTINKIIFAGRP